MFGLVKFKFTGLNHTIYWPAKIAERSTTAEIILSNYGSTKYISLSINFVYLGMSEISGAIYRPEAESLKCGFLSISKQKIPSNIITAQLS